MEYDIVLHKCFTPQHDCVIIPDFGAILTHKVSAQIHETKYVLSTKKVLAFANNSNKTIPLANHIAKCESCSYKAIEQLIYYMQIKPQLESKEIIKLKNRIFNLNKEGRLVFKPNNLNAFLIGLSV